MIQGYLARDVHPKVYLIGLALQATLVNLEYMSANNLFANETSQNKQADSIDDVIDSFIGGLKSTEDGSKLYLSSDEDLNKDAEYEDDDAEYGEAGPLFLSTDDEEYDENGILIEDDFDECYNFRDALRSAGNFRVHNKTRQEVSSRSYWKRKMIRSSNRDLDPEVRHTLSQANEAFVRRDLQVSFSLYLDVIKKDPRNFSAYKTLGEICKLQGRLNECCNYWLLAANIHPWHTAFWASVAELSAELGHIDQAIYCYTRAITADVSKSARYILQRAVLYRDKKQYGRALEGFQRVHQIFPRDTAIVKNLASVYVEQKRLNDAINLYMRMLDYNINPGSLKHEQEYPEFGWAELNILLELYFLQHTWRVAVKVTKIAARWMQDRVGEAWWDDNDDDAEFDVMRRSDIVAALSDETLKKSATEKAFDLPIDIRFKLGILRLNMNLAQEAIHHFNFLLSEGEGIADLHFEAGRALEEAGHYEVALAFLTRASSSDEFRDKSELISLLGRCLLEVGDYAQAKQAFETLLHNQPSNLDHRIALAEALYHLGDLDGARNLLIQAAAKREKIRMEKEALTDHDINDLGADQDESVPEFDSSANSALIRNQTLIRSARSTKLTDSEKMEVETNAKHKVLEKYRRMNRLQESVDNGELVAIKAWIQLASQLIEMFMSVRSFFPRDRNRVFQGFVLHRRKKEMGIDEKLARLYNLYEGIVNDEYYTRQLLTSKTEYRGLSYTTWFDMFLQYILLLSKFDKNDSYALEIIEVAMSVNVFIQDKLKESLLWFARLIVGREMGDFSITVTNAIRHFLITNQFSPTVYRLFMCCFSSGVKAWEVSTNYNHQKYFLRQLKSYHSLLYGKKISGMAQIVADVKGVTFERESPDILYLYSNLLGGSRSYVSSLVYLNQVYREYNHDPIVCLVLGLAHVHRSMQRLSSNRHIQLLQGISYFIEYLELREKNATIYELQEVQYNFGRLFHMIGLSSLAIRHYKKVLSYHESLEKDDPYDLLFETAYNMTLIYNLGGNGMLASELTKKYLVV